MTEDEISWRHRERFLPAVSTSTPGPADRGRSARHQDTSLPVEWDPGRAAVPVPSRRLPDLRGSGELQLLGPAEPRWSDGYQPALDPWATTRAHRVNVSGVAYTWVGQSHAQPLRVYASARYRTAVANVALTARLLVLVAVSVVVLLIAVHLIGWLT